MYFVRLPLRVYVLLSKRVEVMRERKEDWRVCACVAAGGVSTMHFWAELLTAVKD